MKYLVEIKSDIAQRAFEKALSFDFKSRGDFFHDIRQSFKEEIENLLIKQGIQVNKKSLLGYTNLRSGKVFEVDPIKNKSGEKLGIEFCSGYGHDDYSLKAINYIDGEYCELPSLLPFFKSEEFSIGNVAILVENGDYDIEINTQGNIKIVGYSYHISSRKKKSYLCLFGIRFKYELLESVFEKYYKNCDCKDSDLDEIRIGVIHYPIIFICRRCCQLFVCKCFENYFDIKDDIIRILPCGHSHYGIINHNHDKCELKKHVEKIKIRDNICHLCTNSIPKLQYGHKMYYSAFLQRYLPYFELLKRKDKFEYLNEEKKLCKEIENSEKDGNGLISEYINVGKELQLLNEQCILPPKPILNGKRKKFLNLVAQGSRFEEIIYDDYVKTLKYCISKEFKKDITVLKGRNREVFSKYYEALINHENAIKDFKQKIENKLRKRFDYPLIGEKWISETMLYKIVKTLFTDKKTLFHYRGNELEGLEIDIFIPELKLAIEYQGEQHFQAVEHWGGAEGLNKRMESDRKKQTLCKKFGYNLIEFKYDEDLTVENVEKKLREYLRDV